MKIIKKGKNLYKKANWFQEKEKEIYIMITVILGFVDFILLMLIRG